MIVDPPHDHHVDLDRLHTRLFGRHQSGHDLLQTATGDLMKALGVQAVETDVDATHTVGLQDRCLFRQL